MPDEEIREVRAIRHAISAECGHDVHKVLAYYRAVEDELRQSGQYEFAPIMSDPKDSRTAPPVPAGAVP